ncbi:DNA-binding transcriptional regulator YhcF (GntR family) [Neomicrococcus aestuarii]|uniref:DNA-binding transcriptional regulator YhcF (GntR family) n=1 Tax=Neomicrococcus aestuarii TaxID=556325 RepID=A0A7W8TV77_9MICC|nr:GntR family transcriptional regulator [Neomicrococcus aestuarii]MBB5512638.1 DNA-binding transcriptional regulator YhcF (GntR family) [Neomicrococcus aestuarii]
MTESAPIFIQLSRSIEEGILDGLYPEETQVPSTNEFASFMRINPATAGKALNRLVDQGILYKKRGIGMFVATGARQQLVQERRDAFTAAYIEPLVSEAQRLGIPADQLQSMIAATASTTLEGATS